MYFRERSAKANKPPYSGFETIVDISTGIVRNLLDPCYWMFDNALKNNKDGITQISPKIQNQKIVELYYSGQTITNLCELFFLSDKTIRGIIRKYESSAKEDNGGFKDE